MLTDRDDEGIEGEGGGGVCGCVVARAVSLVLVMSLE